MLLTENNYGSKTWELLVDFQPFNRLFNEVTCACDQGLGLYIFFTSSKIDLTHNRRVLMIENTCK